MESTCNTLDQASDGFLPMTFPMHSACSSKIKPGVGHLHYDVRSCKSFKTAAATMKSTPTPLEASSSSLRVGFALELNLLTAQVSAHQGSPGIFISCRGFKNWNGFLGMS